MLLYFFWCPFSRRKFNFSFIEHGHQLIYFLIHVVLIFAMPDKKLQFNELSLVFKLGSIDDDVSDVVLKI